ncbi:MAG: hypothetical protein DLM73_11015 [Chthoniobacterales bacterium]|nr:MAG: hypothetical protein DLM73_11015 [Chthoniobacterales bacterium]
MGLKKRFCVFHPLFVQRQENCPASPFQRLFTVVRVSQEILERGEQERTEFSLLPVRARIDFSVDQENEKTLRQVLRVVHGIPPAPHEAIKWRPIDLAKLGQGRASGFRRVLTFRSGGNHAPMGRSEWITLTGGDLSQSFHAPGISDAPGKNKPRKNRNFLQRPPRNPFGKRKYPSLETNPMKTRSNNVIDCRVFWKHLTLLLLSVLACLALSTSASAKPDGLKPPPDGGYASHNTAEGDSALFSLRTGFGNTAIGFETLYSDTAGSYNVATGHHALFSLTTGNFNVATGTGALFYNTTGDANTASGAFALNSNTTGHHNTANGLIALANNTTGRFNTATGVAALNLNTTGDYNTADGVEALTLNTTGIENTANGFEALFSNTTGSDNTANGVVALFSNTTGHDNTATGVSTLNVNSTGSENTADGVGALGNNTTGSDNTAGGFQALVNNTTGGNNIALGNDAGLNLTTGSNNIDIGNYNTTTSVSTDAAGENNTIRIGVPGMQTATFIAGISGIPISGAPVVVNANGQLGVAASSVRFKDQIKPMNSASEGILALKPVTFHYKNEIDPKGTPQFGLIAEEVAKVNPDLVARDVDGKIYTVRYDAVNAMLLNEFLKEHQQVQELKVAAAQQQKEIEALTASLKQQAAQIQKVSAQLDVSKPAPQLVGNNR